MCELEKTDGGWWSEGLLWTSAHYFARRRACYACIFPHKDNRPFNEQGSEDRAIPVFSTTPGIIGVLQAQEALKILLGVGKALVGKMLFYDGLTTTFQQLEVGRVSDCPCCGQL